MTYGWYAWMAFFLVWEGIALKRKPDGDTFSEHVWKWAAVGAQSPTKLAWGIRGLTALVTLWLVPHLTLGWFTPTNPVPW